MYARFVCSHETGEPTASASPLLSFFISRTLGAPLPALIIAILLHFIGHVPLLWRVLVLCLQVVLTTVITVLIAIIVV